MTKSGKSGSVDERVLEACTQLFAREKYDKILEAYGVNAINKDAIKYNGYGYNRLCDKLRPLFSKKGVVQIGELVNITNGTESGERIVRKKLKQLGMRDNDMEIWLLNILLN